MNKKIVLAYSGGLDTSVAIKWLSGKGYDVIAYMADVGQDADYDTYKKRGLPSILAWSNRTALFRLFSDRRFNSKKFLPISSSRR